MSFSPEISFFFFYFCHGHHPCGIAYCCKRCMVVFHLNAAGLFHNPLCWNLGDFPFGGETHCSALCFYLCSLLRVLLWDKFLGVKVLRSKLCTFSFYQIKPNFYPKCIPLPRMDDTLFSHTFAKFSTQNVFRFHFILLFSLSLPYTLTSLTPRNTLPGTSFTHRALCTF